MVFSASSVLSAVKYENVKRPQFSSHMTKLQGGLVKKFLIHMMFQMQMRMGMDFVFMAMAVYVNEVMVPKQLFVF